MTIESILDGYHRWQEGLYQTGEHMGFETQEEAERFAEEAEFRADQNREEALLRSVRAIGVEGIAREQLHRALLLNKEYEKALNDVFGAPTLEEAKQIAQRALCE